MGIIWGETGDITENIAFLHHCCISDQYCVFFLTDKLYNLDVAAKYHLSWYIVASDAVQSFFIVICMICLNRHLAIYFLNIWCTEQPMCFFLNIRALGWKFQKILSEVNVCFFTLEPYPKKKLSPYFSEKKKSTSLFQHPIHVLSKIVVSNFEPIIADSFEAVHIIVKKFSWYLTVVFS